ncbi:TPA: glycosyltransferase family 1 protein, partial [Candidatus Poribacteria bacterium]|nr:glycosyltransferase family 1 protein [Candidatus Poribacteria bacterium]
MIGDRDIIIVSSDDWGIGLKTSKYHLATKMALFNNRVLFVESTGLRSPKLSRFDLRRITGKFKGMMSKLRWVQPNIFLLTPPAIPLHRFRPIRALNSILLTLSIKSAISELRFRSPILFIF